VIRLFHHYVHRRILLQVFFDFGLIMSTVVGVILVHGEDPQVLLAITATHGLSLATGMFVINSASGFYQPTHNRSLQQSMARAALAAMFALPLAYGIFRVLPVEADGSNALVLAAMLGVAAVIVNRVYAAHSAGRARTRTRILVLGSGPAAQLVGETIRTADPQAEIVGYFRGPNEQQLAVPASQLMPGDESLAATALRSGVHEIIVALTERRGGSMSLRDLLDCRIHGINVSDLSTHFEKMLGQIRIDHVNASWLIFGDGFNQGLLRTTIKRLFDIVCAMVLLVAAAPIMLATMVLIRLESRGPALYRQERVGLNGRTFRVVKFRSMVTDAEKDGKPRWATDDDDRITRVGRLIRRVRIDELPQLFNVLKGEMSIVGPRPERPFFVEQLTSEMPYYAVRHSVKPGITGWAQVRYHYGSTVEDSQQKLQYDLYYVKNHTLFLDLLILFETVAVVLTGKGAR
jgi:sugar transferase (PEP-CTERM system associated)